MSNWNRWKPVDNHVDSINLQFAKAEDPGEPHRFAYPNLRDGSVMMLASDYSGEHARPEFQVLSFLLTTRRSVFQNWEPSRLAIRKRYLTENRRMSFKDLRDAMRINALLGFLDAGSLLNGILICVAVEKAHSITAELGVQLQHAWTADTLQKLLRICVFGAGFVDGLRGPGQHLHWITDDDAVVVNDNARNDAMAVMGGLLHKYTVEYPQIRLGVASLFADDEMRAEDLVAIPDLAAGAFSEGLSELGKANIPKAVIGPSGANLFLQTKTSLITAWRFDNTKPLKHLNVVVRVAEGGQSIVSFCQPFVRLPRPWEKVPEIPPLNAKWKNALGAMLERKGS